MKKKNPYYKYRRYAFFCKWRKWSDAGMKSRDMLDELRMVSRNLELETEDFCSVDSANIFPEDWARLAELIAKEAGTIRESQ